MKRFILKSVLFISPLIIFLFYIEFHLKLIPNSYSFKRKCLEEQLDSIQVLVLGSSQSYHGINPAYFKLNTFNLSNVSQSLFYDTKLTLKYIDKMPKLKYVIINISYFSLGSALIDGTENWRSYYYSQYWDVNYPEIKLYDLKKYSQILLYTPQISFSYFRKNFEITLTEGIDRKGYLKNDSTNSYKNINDTLGHKRVLFHDNKFNESRYIENRNYLESLLSSLKKRNIIPLIITPPVFSTYSKYADKNKIKKNNEIINYLCKKYNCQYLDYFTDNRFVKSDFKDNDHLNFAGAEKFSKILNEKLKGITQ